LFYGIYLLFKVFLGVSREMIDIAIQNGCKTIKDFADFLKLHNPKSEIIKSGKEIVQLSLLR